MSGCECACVAGMEGTGGNVCQCHTDSKRIRETGAKAIRGSVRGAEHGCAATV